MTARIVTYLFLFIPSVVFAQADFTHYVDPFIGTGGHGHTYPGAVLPHGMVQLSPDTRNDGSWDGCSGYHYSDSALYGFSHTHLSGTGCSDYGDILLLPFSGKVMKEDLQKQKFKSRFSHNSEKASPGFYAVKIDDGNIDVELTSTTSVGFHKYMFSQAEQDANIILDLVHRDKVLDASFVIVNNHRIEGYRRSQGWASNQTVMFVMEFSQPFTDVLTAAGSVMNEKKAIKGTNLRACFRFKPAGNKPVLVKVALSPVSTEGATKNMMAELPSWDFEKTKMKAKEEWNKELSCIKVSGGTEEQLKIFYTSLYHCMVVPNVAMDVDGSYRGRDDKMHVAKSYTYYSVFSLWDTFRAWHPLMTIIDRKRTLDYIKTFLAQYEQGGLLPVWELSSNETECMIGYHSVSVIADAMVKGITGFDYEEAFTAMKKSAEARNRFGLGFYIDRGFLSSEDEHESVSKTLEYAYDDWCIAQAASLLHHDDDYIRYMQRAQSWKNIFNKETGFIQARKNGGWYTPFEPREVNNNYTEANAWQYTFFVPQDVTGLINYMGGAEAFEKKLDDLFTTESLTTGRELSDISGLIGQYAHGNEPSHGMAYLYNYIGKPWKMQQRVQQIMNDFYKTGVEGIIGNEDCGQMSAWYVLNAMGFYQDCPGNTRYILCPSVFTEVTISLESGKTFTLINPSADRVQYTPAFLDYETIMKGGTVKAAQQPTCEEFAKMDQSKSAIGAAEKIFPVDFAPVPAINAASRSFRDSLLITMTSFNAKRIFYILNGATRVYEAPFYIYEDVTLNAWATYGAAEADRKMERRAADRASRSVEARFQRMPHPERYIRLLSAYAPQYAADGNDALIDGIRGDEDWRKGNWQGYQGRDMECVIDLGTSKTINTCSSGFLQDAGAWIMMPKQVEYSFSDDGINFTNTCKAKNALDDSKEDVFIRQWSCRLEKPLTSRYVKVKATTYGKLPKLENGEGGDAWIFSDEITIE